MLPGVLGDTQREIMSSDLLRLFGSYISQRKKKNQSKPRPVNGFEVIKLYNQRCLDLEGNVEVISIDIHGMIIGLMCERSNESNKSPTELPTILP